MYYTNNQARTPRFYECANNVRYAEETIPVFARWFGSWQVSVQRLAFSSRELTRRYDQATPGWCRTLDRLGYPGAYETLLRSVMSLVPAALIAFSVVPIAAGSIRLAELAGVAAITLESAPI
jgi:hypothetical protein